MSASSSPQHRSSTAWSGEPVPLNLLGAAVVAGVGGGNNSDGRIGGVVSTPSSTPPKANPISRHNIQRRAASLDATSGNSQFHTSSVSSSLQILSSPSGTPPPPPPPQRSEIDFVVGSMLRSGEWRIAVDTVTNRPYYYSTVDGVTTWDLAAIVRSVMRVEVDVANAVSNISSVAATPSSPPVVPPYQEEEQQQQPEVVRGFPPDVKPLQLPHTNESHLARAGSDRAAYKGPPSPSISPPSASGKNMRKTKLSPRSSASPDHPSVPPLFDEMTPAAVKAREACRDGGSHSTTSRRITDTDRSDNAYFYGNGGDSSTNASGAEDYFVRTQTSPSPSATTTTTMTTARAQELGLTTLATPKSTSRARSDSMGTHRNRTRANTISPSSSVHVPTAHQQHTTVTSASSPPPPVGSRTRRNPFASPTTHQEAIAAMMKQSGSSISANDDNDDKVLSGSSASLQGNDKITKPQQAERPSPIRIPHHGDPQQHNDASLSGSNKILNSSGGGGDSSHHHHHHGRSSVERRSRRSPGAAQSMADLERKFENVNEAMKEYDSCHSHVGGSFSSDPLTPPHKSLLSEEQTTPPSQRQYTSHRRSPARRHTYMGASGGGSSVLLAASAAMVAMNSRPPENDDKKQSNPAMTAVLPSATVAHDPSVELDPAAGGGESDAQLRSVTEEKAAGSSQEVNIHHKPPTPPTDVSTTENVEEDVDDEIQNSSHQKEREKSAANEREPSGGSPLYVASTPPPPPPLVDDEGPPDSLLPAASSQPAVFHSDGNDCGTEENSTTNILLSPPVEEVHLSETEEQGLPPPAAEPIHPLAVSDSGNAGRDSLVCESGSSSLQQHSPQGASENRSTAPKSSSTSCLDLSLSQPISQAPPPSSSSKRTPASASTSNNNTTSAKPNIFLRRAGSPISRTTPQKPPSVATSPTAARMISPVGARSPPPPGTSSRNSIFAVDQSQSQYRSASAGSNDAEQKPNAVSPLPSSPHPHPVHSAHSRSSTPSLHPNHQPMRHGVSPQQHGASTRRSGTPQIDRNSFQRSWHEELQKREAELVRKREQLKAEREARAAKRRESTGGNRHVTASPMRRSATATHPPSSLNTSSNSKSMASSVIVNTKSGAGSQKSSAEGSGSGGLQLPLTAQERASL